MRSSPTHCQSTHTYPSAQSILFILSSCWIQPPSSSSPNREREREEEDELRSKMASSGKGKVFTLEEVAKHSAKDDCWLVIGGKVPPFSFFLSFFSPEIRCCVGFSATPILCSVHRF